jgi:hypothetical protein
VNAVGEESVIVAVSNTGAGAILDALDAIFGEGLSICGVKSQADNTNTLNANASLNLIPNNFNYSPAFIIGKIMEDA